MNLPWMDFASRYENSYLYRISTHMIMLYRWMVSPTTSCYLVVFVGASPADYILSRGRGPALISSIGPGPDIAKNTTDGRVVFVQREW
jgi:hypothetical protein